MYYFVEVVSFGQFGHKLIVDILGLFLLVLIEDRKMFVSGVLEADIDIFFIIFNDRIFFLFSESIVTLGLSFLSLPSVKFILDSFKGIIWGISKLLWEGRMIWWIEKLFVLGSLAHFRFLIFPLQFYLAFYQSFAMQLFFELGHSVGSVLIFSSDVAVFVETAGGGAGCCFSQGPLNSIEVLVKLVKF